MKPFFLTFVVTLRPCGVEHCWNLGIPTYVNSLLFAVEHSLLQVATKGMDKPTRIDLGYSLKNIPIPPNNAYTARLIQKTESLIKRMRWKAHFFLHGDDNSTQRIDNSHLLYMPMRIPHNKNKLSRDKSISCLMFALAFSYVHETQRYNVCFYNWWNHSFWPL